MVWVIARSDASAGIHSSKAISPTASKATRTPTAGWTPEEVSKMNKYLIKEASGDSHSPLVQGLFFFILDNLELI